MFLRNKEEKEFINLITGKDLGTSHSSAAQGIEILPSKPLGAAEIEVNVNLSKLSFVVKDRPIRIAEKSGTIELRYIFNQAVKEIAKGWRLATRKLSFPADKKAIIMTEEDGCEITFKEWNNNDTFKAENWNKSGTPLLTRVPGSKNLRIFYPDTGCTELYDENGLLFKKTDKEGHSISYKYNTFGEITEINGGSSYEINRTKGKVEIISKTKNADGQDVNQVLQTYLFDDLGRLKESISSDNYKVRYGYQQNSLELSSIEQDDGQYLKAFARDRTSRKYFDRIEISAPSDERERRLVYDFKKTSNKVEIIKQDGQDTYEVFLDALERVEKHTLPRGLGAQYSEKFEDAVSYTYQPKGQLHTKSYLEQLTSDEIKKLSDKNSSTETKGNLEKEYGKEIFEYSKLYDLVNVHIDVNGKTEKYNYAEDINSAVIVTKDEMLNEADSLETHYIYSEFKIDGENKLRIKFSVSPAGRVIEYIYDKDGYIEQTIQHREKFFKWVSGTGELVLLEWLKKVDKQQSIIKKYNRNTRGQITDTIDYTHVNAEGMGIANDTASFETTLWEQSGLDYWRNRQVKQDEKVIQTEARQCDGIGRLIENKVSSGEFKSSTNFAYTNYVPGDGKSSPKLATIKITHPNGREEIKKIGTSGAMLSNTVIVDKVERKTEYWNDLNARPLVTILPDKSRIATCHNRQNQVSYVITELGCATKYIYDPVARSKTTIKLADKIEPSAIYDDPKYDPDIDSIISEFSAKEKNILTRITTEFYNPSGVLVYTVDAEKNLIEHLTDKLNRDCGKIAYATKISDGDLQKLREGKSLDLAVDIKTDRVHQKYYDKDSLVIGERDSAGYITEYIRDAAGLIIEKIEYNSATEIFKRGNDFEKVKPEDKSAGRTHYTYDGRKQLTSVIDPEGRVTTYLYNAGGLRTESYRYVKKMDAKWIENPTMPPVLPKKDVEDKVVTYKYDYLNREVAQIDKFGQTISTQYDEMGQDTFHGVSDSRSPEIINGDTCRSKYKRYDKWGQVEKETNPFISMKLSQEKDESKVKEIWDKFAISNEYNETGLKISSKDSQGHITLYYYDVDRRPVAAIDPTGALKYLTLNTFGEILKTRHYMQRINEATLINLKGGIVGKKLLTLFEELKTAEDIEESSEYYLNGNLKSSTDGNSNKTIYERNAFGECKREIKPLEGESLIVIDRKFDTRGLEIKKIEIADGKERVIQTLREDRHGSVTKQIDAENGETYFVHDQVGDLKETINPIKGKTTYTRDGLGRLDEETDPLGNIFTYSYDKKTGQEITHLPKEANEEKESVALTLKTTKNIFQEVISVEDPLGNTQAWQHAPDGQVSLHTDELNNKTTTKHDNEGNIEEIISPDNIVNKLKHNAAHQLEEITEDIKGKKPYATVHKLDAVGRVVQTTDPEKVINTQSYDRCNNPTLLTIDAEEKGLNLTTNNEYTSQSIIKSIKKGDLNTPNKFIQVIVQNGLATETKVTTDPVNLESKTSLAITVVHKHDLMSRIKEEVDAKGNILRNIYDEAGNKRFAIDASGGINEWQYNKCGKITLTRSYSQRLSKDATLDNILELITPQDAVTHFYYDKKGNERFRIGVVSTGNGKVQGIVHETTNDKAGRPTKFTHYKNTLDYLDSADYDTPKLEDWVKEFASIGKDRTNYRILDAKGQELFVIDPKGVVTEKVYDAKGHVITQHIYSNPVKETAGLTIENIRAAIKCDPKNDKSEYSIYNSLGHLEFHLNPEKAITYYKTNYYGDVELECRYAKKAESFATYNELAVQLKSLIPNRLVDQVTENHYDHARRIDVTTDAMGQKKYFTYTALGKIETKTDEANKVWRYEYDSANRLIHEFTPELSSLCDAEGKPLRIKTTYKHDKAGNVESTTESENEKSIFDSASTFDACNSELVKKINLSERMAKNESKATTTQISKENVYDAQHRKIAEKNSAGEWTFNIYDSQGRKIFDVNQLGSVISYKFDSFDNIVKKISHSYKISFDFDKSIKEGISLQTLREKLTFSTTDIVEDMEYDIRGQLLFKSSYLSGSESPDHIKAFEYDSFARVISEADIADTSQLKTKNYAKKIFIHDRTDKIVAEIEPSLHVKRFEHDTFGEVLKTTSYLQPLKEAVDTSITIDELDKKITTSIYDRTNEFERDLLNRVKVHKQTNVLLQKMKEEVKILKNEKKKLKESKNNSSIESTNQIDAIVQKIKAIHSAQKHIIEDSKPETIKKEYAYSPTGKLIKITEGELSENNFYDERGKLIGKTEVPRLCINDQGEDVIVTPLIHYILNSLGQAEGEIRYKQGAKPFDAKCMLPEPVAEDKDDQYKSITYDKLDAVLSTTIDPKRSSPKRVNWKESPPAELAIVTKTEYNAARKPISKTDANGNVTRILYDEMNCERFTIDAYGFVKELTYNAHGLKSSEKKYALKIPTAGITDSSTTKDIEKLLKSSFQDTLSYLFYDGAQHECFKLDVLDTAFDEKGESIKNAAVINEHRYNSAGHLIQKITYSKTMDAKELPTKTIFDLKKHTSEFANALKDHSTYYINNSAGEALYTLSPTGTNTRQGVIKYNEYDAYGNSIRETIYSNRAENAEELANLSPEEFAKHIKADPEKDRTSFRVFNYFNKISWVMGPEGNIKRYAYDSHGNKIGKTRFAKLISIPKNYAEFLQAIKEVVPDIKKDQTTANEYDNANQLKKQYDAEGFFDEFKHDSFGRLTRNINRAGEQTITEHDTANRRIKIISPKIEATTVSRDAESKLTTSTVLASPVEKITPDAVGNPISIIKGYGSSDERELKASFSPSRKEEKTVIDDVKIDDPKMLARFSVLPEITVTIKTDKFYNGSDEVVAEMNESGQCTFHIFDSRNKEIFQLQQCDENDDTAWKVKEIRHDVFGYVKKEILYATKITIDLSKNIIDRQGISFEDIRDKIVTNDKDRTVTFKRNKLGNPTSIQSSKILYATEGVVLEGYPETEIEYDTFEQQILSKVLVEADKWAAEIAIFDRRGSKLLFKNKSDLLIRKIFDAFNHEKLVVEYDDKQSIKALRKGSTLVELDNLKELNKPKELAIEYEHDLRGLKTAQHILNVIIQKEVKEAKSDRYSLQDELCPKLSTYTIYNAMGKEAAIVDPQKLMSFIFYNACTDIIARTNIPFSLSPDSKPELAPLTFLGRSIHGEEISILNVKSGTGPVDISVLPKPHAEDKDGDQLQLTLKNKRGLTIATQDAEGFVECMTHTAGRQLARTWKRGHKWVQPKGDLKLESKNEELKPLAKANFISDVSIIDEDRHGYNSKTGVETSHSKLRNNEVKEKSEFKHNTFDEVIEEGFGDGKTPYYSEFDASGHAWKSNRGNGSCVISLPNLAGHETLRMESATKKEFKDAKYSDIKALSQDPEVEHTLSGRDEPGRIVSRTSPFLFQVPLDSPLDCPIQIDARENILSWETPAISVSSVIFRYYPVGKISEAKELKIETAGNRSMVNVAHLTADQYDYSIEYFPLTPQESKNGSKCKYKTIGRIQCGAVKEGSKELVIRVDEVKPYIVYLTGNTNSIEELKLISVDGDEIGKPIKLIEDKETGRLFVNLEQYETGFYRLRPIPKSGTADSPKVDTIEFPIYKKVAEDAVSISPKFSFSAKIVTEGKVAAIILNVPKELYGQTIKFSCEYLTAESKDPIKHEATLNFGVDSHKSCYLTSLAEPIKTINSISISIKHKVHDSKDEFFWIDLYKDSQPLPSDLKPLRNLVPKSLVNRDPNLLNESEPEDDDFVLLDSDNLNSGDHKHSLESSEFVFSAASSKIEFLPHSIAYVNLKNVGKNPIIKYKDVSVSGNPIWKEIDCIGSNCDGVFLDVSDFSPGNYPYALNEVEKPEQRFCISDGGMVIPSLPYVEAPVRQKVQRLFEFDAWDNATAETNSLGQRTQFEFNFRNQQIMKIQPAVECMEPDGTLVTKPIITMTGFNKIGAFIGIINPMKKSSVKIVNEKGLVLRDIEADGVVKRENTFNLLSQLIRYKNSTRNDWIIGYNGKNEIIQILSPENYKRIFILFNGKRIGDNSAGVLRLYDFDWNLNVSSYRYPDGVYMIEMNYNRYRKMILQMYIKNGVPFKSMDWQFNDFGHLEKHTDLSGALYNYELDLKMQRIRQTSKGGNHGKCLIYTKKTERIKVNMGGFYNYVNVVVHKVDTSQKVPDQDLKFININGRMTSVIDSATSLESRYKLDPEDRRIAVEVLKLAGESLSYRECVRDAIGREIESRDGMMSVFIKYDAVSNRRHFIFRLINPITKEVIEREFYNVFDDANRETYDGATGIERVFVNGLIDTETYKDIQTKMSYARDQLLAGTQKKTSISSPIPRILSETENVFDDQRQVKSFIEKHHLMLPWPQTIVLEHESIIDDNGFVKEQKTVQTAFTKKETTVKSTFPTRLFSEPLNGEENFQHTFYQGQAIEEDKMEQNFIGFDSWMLSSVSGKRKKKGEDFGDTSVARQFYNPNGGVGGIFGSDYSAKNYLPRYIIPFGTYNGLMLSRVIIPAGNLLGLSILTQYFHTVDDQFLGSYITRTLEGYIMDFQIGLGNLKESAKLIGPGGYSENANLGIGLPRDQHVPEGKTIPTTGHVEDKYASPNVMDISSVVSAITNTNQPPAPSFYIVPRDEKVEEAAAETNCDAASLAIENGFEIDSMLDQGMSIRLPQMIEIMNKSGMYPAYATFLNRVIGQLAPHLEVKDQDTGGFLKQIIAMAVMGLILIAAPHLAPILLQVLGPMLGAILGTGAIATHAALAICTGISAAFLDAVGQGVCIKLHVQDHFSLKQCLATGLTSGLGVGSGPGMGVMESVISAGIGAVEAQLIMMGTGLSKFDPRQIFVAMFAAAANSKLNLPTKTVTQRFAKNMVDSTTTSLIAAGVYRQQPQVSMIAAQALTSSATREIAGTINAKVAEMKALREQELAVRNAQTEQAARPKTAYGSTLNFTMNADRSKNSNRFFSSNSKAKRDAHDEVKSTRAKAFASSDRHHASDSKETQVSANEHGRAKILFPTRSNVTKWPKWEPSTLSPAEKLKGVAEVGVHIAKNVGHAMLGGVRFNMGLEEQKISGGAKLLMRLSGKSEHVLEGLKTAEFNALTSPEEWSNYTAPSLTAISVGIAKNYHVLANESKMQAHAMMQNHVKDFMAAETGRDLNVKFAGIENARAAKYSSYAKILKPLAIAGKLPNALYLSASGVEIYHASQRGDTRAMVDKAAQVAGVYVGSWAAAYAVGFMAAPSLGTSLLALPASTLAGGTAGAYYFEKWADKIYDNFEGKKNKFGRGS